MALAISVSVMSTRGGNPMRLGLLLLVAAALSATLFSPLPSADARGVRSKHVAHKADAAPRRSSRLAPKSQVREARMTSAKQPGGCGTFMYWKDGKCNDARNKK
jgi:hypothetical protein